MKRKSKTRLAEWQDRAKSGKEKCAKCGEMRHLNVDHIVPCHILEQFGLDKIETLYNMEENFEILCRYCNQMKAARIDVKNPKTYQVLEKIINQTKKYYGI